LLLQADDAKNVTVRTEVLSDEELAEVILDSAMVVLPYRNMYNSGAALLSLTLHRPILVPDTGTMRELRREVGDNWVHLYEGELTTEHVRAALRATAATPGGGPDLSRRDWARVGLSYAALYDSIVRTKRIHRGSVDTGRPGSGPPTLPGRLFRRPRGTAG
jgi:beta-1,4-mannosyltransferase